MDKRRYGAIRCDSKLYYVSKAFERYEMNKIQEAIELLRNKRLNIYVRTERALALLESEPAENKKRKTECETKSGGILCMELEDQLKAKDEALREYGRHGRRSDGIICEREKHSDYPCTCGFEQALKGV